MRICRSFSAGAKAIQSGARCRGSTRRSSSASGTPLAQSDRMPPSIVPVGTPRPERPVRATTPGARPYSRGTVRSEERRVGKECRCGGRRDDEKKELGGTDVGRITAQGVEDRQG